MEFGTLGAYSAIFLTTRLPSSSVVIPVPFAQMVRHVLHKAGQDVFPCGRERRVCIGRDYAIHPKLFRNFAKLGDVVTTFRKRKRRDERVEGALESCCARRSSGEARLGIEH